MRAVAFGTAGIWLAAATAAWAEGAGPPRPIASKRTPAEQAIAAFAERDEHNQAANVCAPSRAGEIVVCGNGRSPYRLPLPGERGPPDQRIATGDIPRGEVGDGPVPVARGGVSVPFPQGKRAQVRNATLKLIYAQERAAAEKAAAEKALAEKTP